MFQRIKFSLLYCNIFNHGLKIQIELFFKIKRQKRGIEFRRIVMMI